MCAMSNLLTGNDIPGLIQDRSYLPRPPAVDLKYFQRERRLRNLSRVDTYSYVFVCSRSDRYWAALDFEGNEQGKAATILISTALQILFRV